MITTFNLNNIYLENNQNIQYIKHSKYRQDSETSNLKVTESECIKMLLKIFTSVPAEVHPQECHLYPFL
jgi:hypothetical protein